MTRDEAQRTLVTDAANVRDVVARADAAYETLLHEYDIHTTAPIHLGMVLARLRSAIEDLSNAAYQLDSAHEFYIAEAQRAERRKAQV